MSSWKNMLLCEAIDFNPSESIEKGSEARKIPMGMLTEFTRKIKGSEYSKYNYGSKFRNGDTVLAKITPCLENGKTAFVDILDDNEVAFGSSEFIVLRATRHTDPEYVYYLAVSPTFRKRAMSCMEGTSGRKRVNENTLKYFSLPFPPVKTQQKIANVLSTIDAKIELNNKINAELEAMAKLVYDYWFVQFDFPADLHDLALSGAEGYKSSGGKMEYNEELKQEIPEGWEVKSLGEVTDLKAGGEKPKEWTKKKTERFNIPIYSNGVTENGLYGFAEIAKIFEPSITISARGTIGFTALRLKPFVPIVRLVSVTPIASYMLNFLKERIKLLEFENSGSVQKQLTVPMVSEMRILVPEKLQLTNYENFTTPLIEKIETNKEQNQELASLRDWLLPMLMNGQVTVGEAEAKVKEYGSESMAAEVKGI